MYIKRYCCTFTLHNERISPLAVRQSLVDVGDNLDVAAHSADEQKGLAIRIDTIEPAVVFDICSQFGRLGRIKVEELK